MSPHRRTKRSRQASSTNPYTQSNVRYRKTKPSDESPGATATSCVASTQVDQTGFPSLVQYKQIEAAYLDALSPRRRAKALISQDMFDRIWDVLHGDGDDEKAQFRFWARNMFTLGRPRRKANIRRDDESDSDDDGDSSSNGEVVLLHDGVPVAVKEQMYELLCYCHANAGHGGRDRTCSVIRSHYSWIPKDLVARFVKKCPTCIMKKCGNPDITAVIDEKDALVLIKKEDMAALRTELQELAEQDARDGLDDFMDGPLAPRVYESSSDESLTSIDSTTNFNPYSIRSPRPIHKFPGSMTGLTSVPMTREVSLFRGRPNGWQYQTSRCAAGTRLQAPSPHLPPLLEKRMNAQSASMDTYSSSSSSSASISGSVYHQDIDPALDLLALRATPVPPSALPSSLQRFLVLPPVRTYECLGEPLLDRTPVGKTFTPISRHSGTPTHSGYNISPLTTSQYPSNDQSSSPSSISTRRHRPALSVDLSSLSSLQSLGHLMRCADNGSQSPVSPYSPAGSSSSSGSSCNLGPGDLSPASATGTQSSGFGSSLATPVDGEQNIDEGTGRKLRRVERHFDLTAILN
ncbi:hypothetical protein HGRIS_007025 [Hohenbuehelia grisea]|uniref:Integrase zinc-binding domain-containing protein n=1 Tax=Hohenbuehelia grisea TaxID=104357 RepID=A0ABR3JBC8_9AGAR